MNIAIAGRQTLDLDKIIVEILDTTIPGSLGKSCATSTLAYNTLRLWQVLGHGQGSIGISIGKRFSLEVRNIKQCFYAPSHNIVLLLINPVAPYEFEIGKYSGFAHAPPGGGGGFSFHRICWFFCDFWAIPHHSNCYGSVGKQKTVFLHQSSKTPLVAHPFQSLTFLPLQKWPLFRGCNIERSTGRD